MADRNYTLSIKVSADTAQAKRDIQAVSDTASRAVRPTLPQPSYRPMTVPQGTNRPVGTPPPSITGSGASGGGMTALPQKGALATAVAATAAKEAAAVYASAFAAATSKIKAAFSALRAMAQTAFAAVAAAARKVGSVIRTAILVPVKLANGALGLLRGSFGLLKGVAIGAGFAILANFEKVKAALNVLKPAGEFEQYQNQLSVLLKSQTKATQRFNELKKYAKETNFNPDEVIAAGSAMQAFGLWTDDGMKRLRLAGDAANSFGMNLQDVVRSINYLAAGRGGEAMESLSRMGITREKLKPFGVKFKKSGEMITEPKKAVKGVFKYIEANMGGMTARMGKTWKGATAQFGGEMTDALATGFKGAIPPMVNFLNSITPAITKMGKALGKIDWRGILSGPLAQISGIVNLVGQLADKDTRKDAMDQLSKLWDGLKNTLAVAWEGLGNIFEASLGALSLLFRGIIKDFGQTISNITSNGQWKTLFTAFFSGLKNTFIGGFEYLRGILLEFSPRLKSDLLVALDTMLGALGLEDYSTGEKRRREAVEKNAKSSKAHDAIFDRLYSSGDKDVLAYLEYIRKKEQNSMVLDNSTGQYRRMNADEIYGFARASYFNSRSGKARTADLESQYIAQAMGWDKQEQAAQIHFSKASENIKSAVKDFGAAVGVFTRNLSTDNTVNALKEGGSILWDATRNALSNTAGKYMREVGDPLKASSLKKARADEWKAMQELQNFNKKNSGKMHDLALRGWQFYVTGGVKGELGGKDARKARKKWNTLFEEQSRLRTDASNARANRRAIENSIDKGATGKTGQTSNPAADNLKNTAKNTAATAKTMSDMQKDFVKMQKSLDTIASALTQQDNDVA